MEKIKIFYDKAEEKETSTEIIFEPILAGTTETKSLYLRNQVPYQLDVEIFITGDIEKKVVESIEPGGRIVVNMEASSKKNTTRPIKAELEIKTRCLIK